MRKLIVLYNSKDSVTYYEQEHTWAIDYNKRIIVVTSNNGDYEVIPFDNVIKVMVVVGG